MVDFSKLGCYNINGRAEDCVPEMNNYIKERVI